MNETQTKALAAYLVALADDELILGHRDSEWTGHAPILEEDIAFANLALDEIGHARLWYELAADLMGVERARFPDRQVYFRPAADFRCLQFVELPKGDWAFSMLRQYLFDAFEQHRLARLVKSEYQPLADVAARIRTEEIYHLRHTRAWVPRLGLGTEESRARMQAALDELWPYAQALGAPLPGELELEEEGLVPGGGSLFAVWSAEVTSLLKEAGLLVSFADNEVEADRAVHSEYFPALIADLQEVAQLDPAAQW
ncbi:MAG TPA: 1,2-phenylacetyl-CoA epoxidase subunit PaaC [Anaerolineales bacterium]|nr:1,2-phenylacetyl-CoA epoxidase subunit PaaC [Anaerolineales bacterium]